MKFLIKKQIGAAFGALKADSESSDLNHSSGRLSKAGDFVSFSHGSWWVGSVRITTQTMKNKLE